MRSTSMWPCNGCAVRGENEDVQYRSEWSVIHARPLASTRIVATAVSALSLTALLAGSGQQTTEGQAQAASPSLVKYHFYMDGLTGGMIGKPGLPEFSPADFTLPANADVTVTITNFGDGAAPVSAAYGKVTGTAGDDETINGHSVKSVNPQQVAHTFTIPALNLNVPIPAAASKQSPTVVTFTSHTSKAGSYTWQCTHRVAAV